MEQFNSQIVKALLYLERYQPKALENIEARLATAQQNIIDFISKTQNQRQIRAYIKKELVNALGTFNEDMLEDIENVSGLAWDKFGGIMASGFVTDTIAKEFKKFKAIDKKVKAKLLDEKRLILGNNLDDMKNQMILSANNKLRSAILQGFQQNEDIRTINKSVETTVAHLTRNQARTVTRTVLLNAIEDSKNESFEFFADEIDYWEYSSIMDSRTSPYCLMADGYTTKDRSKAKYQPKSHWNCRSMWLPSTELIREDERKRIVSWERKTVNHRDGTSSTKFKVGHIKNLNANASKETIFKSWSKEEQIRYLGINRYRLFTQGKMTLKDAIDVSRNKLIPLEELEKKLNLI